MDKKNLKETINSIRLMGHVVRDDGLWNSDISRCRDFYRTAKTKLRGITYRAHQHNMDTLPKEAIEETFNECVHIEDGDIDKCSNSVICIKAVASKSINLNIVLTNQACFDRILTLKVIIGGHQLNDINITVSIDTVCDVDLHVLTHAQALPEHVNRIVINGERKNSDGTDCFRYIKLDGNNTYLKVNNVLVQAEAVGVFFKDILLNGAYHQDNGSPLVLREHCMLSKGIINGEHVSFDYYEDAHYKRTTENIVRLINDVGVIPLNKLSWLIGVHEGNFAQSKNEDFLLGLLSAPVPRTLLEEGGVSAVPYSTINGHYWVFYGCGQMKDRRLMDRKRVSEEAIKKSIDSAKEKSKTRGGIWFV